MAQTLLQLTEAGLYCAAGDFYIDPWRGVPRAVVTHAHSDHARWGSQKYLASRESEWVLRARLGEIQLETVPYGQPVLLNGVRVSLHPAGHIVGSAQVRVEYKGEVWVVTGDYKIEADPTCTPFELVRCHSFVTESTFGLPIYRWQPQQRVFDEMNAWWRANAAAGKASMVFGYALGKAQRIQAGLDPSIGPIYAHGAVMRMNEAYERTRTHLNTTDTLDTHDTSSHTSDTSPIRALPEVVYAGSDTDVKRKRGETFAGALIVAPPSAAASPWLRRFGDLSTAFVSGWMRIRGARRRRSVDRGFVLSDHADWPGLTETILNTGAERVWVTHGYTAVLARWAEGQGLEAATLQTRFEGDEEEETEQPGSRDDGRGTADDHPTPL